MGVKVCLQWFESFSFGRLGFRASKAVGLRVSMTVLYRRFLGFRVQDFGGLALSALTGLKRGTRRKKCGAVMFGHVCFVRGTGIT